MISPEYISIVKDFAKKHKIPNQLTIHDNGLVDVDGSVFLYEVVYDKLPITFGEVGGAFFIQRSNIKSLFGFPKRVGASMKIIDNDQLTSLEGFPERVGWSIDIYNNKMIEHSQNNFDLILNCKIVHTLHFDKTFQEAFDRYKTIKEIITA